MKKVELGNWVKVVRDGGVFGTESILYGEVVALGYYKDSPIVTICINMEKFLTVAQELIEEVR